MKKSETTESDKTGSSSTELKSLSEKYSECSECDEYCQSLLYCVNKPIGLPTAIKLNPGAIIPKSISPEKQKHEEIKRMAWEFYCAANEKIGEEDAWNLSVKFYSYAKEKEASDDKN